MAEEPEDHVEDVDEPARVDDTTHGDTLKGDDNGEQTPPPDPVADLAREMGWSPKEDWRGKPEDWKDPASFIRASRDINRRLSSDVRELRQTTERMGRVSASIVDREILRHRSELEAQFEDAVAKGDAKRARETTEDLQRLEFERREAAVPAPKDPAVAEFESANPWLGTHRAATALAVSECEQLARNGVTDYGAQLEIARRAVESRFPELFKTEEKQARGQPSVSAPGSRSSGNSGGKKTAKDLPPDAMRAAQDFLKRGRVGSLQEYADIFFEEQA
jgi:hypothetical protein